MRKGAWAVDRALEEAVLGGFTVSPSGPCPGVCGPAPGAVGSVCPDSPHCEPRLMAGISQGTPVFFSFPCGSATKESAAVL